MILASGGWQAFLFNLQDLTIGFLAVMAVIIVVGVIRARTFRAALRSDLESLSETYRDPERSLSLQLAPIEYLLGHVREESSLKATDRVPGLLITLGILGTFIGLGVAVGDASGTMSSANSADTIESLKELLSAVSFKFQTSAYGIALSIAFQWLVASPLHEFVEHEVEATAEKLLAAYRPPGLSLALAIEAIDRLGASTNEVRTAMETVNVSTRAVEREVKRQAAAAESMKASAGALGASAKALGNTTREFRETATESAKELRGAAEALQGLDKSINSALGDMAEGVGRQLATATNDMGQGVQSALAAIQSSVAESRETTKEALDGTQAILDKTSNFGAQVVALTRQLVDIQGESTSQMNRLLDVAGELARVTSKLEHSPAPSSASVRLTASTPTAEPPAGLGLPSEPDDAHDEVRKAF